MGRGDAHSVCSVDKSKGKTDHDRGFAGSFHYALRQRRSYHGRCKSYFDWIIPALWSEEEEAALEDAPVCIFQYTGNDIGADILQVKSEQLALDVLKHWDVTKVYDPEIRKCLDEQADYVYPYYSEGGMKMKFTVSELKKERRCKKKRERKCIKNHRRFLFFPVL